MKRFFKNPVFLTSLAVLALVIVFSPRAQAQTFDLFGGPQGINASTFITDNSSNSTGSTCPYGGCGGQSQLEQSRQQANQCQAESGGLGGLMQQATSLTSILSQGLQKNLGQTMQNLLQNKIPSIIQSQIQNRLPQVIQGGLEQRLPAALSSQINQMSARGMSQTSIKAALPAIIPQLVQQLITQLLKEKTPEVIQEGLARELPPDVAAELSSQIPSIINSSSLKSQVKDLATSTIAELGQFQNRVTNLDGYTTEVVNGITTQAQNGIVQSSAVNDFSSQLATIVSNQVAPQLINSLLPQFTSAFSGGASSALGHTVDSTVGGLLGSNYNIMGGISGDFFQPISQSLTQSFGTIGSNLGTSLANGSLSIAGPTPEFVTAAMSADDGASLANLSSSAASNVSGSGSQIASAAGTKSGSFTGLGNGLASATTGAIGSGIGGLVSGVPYVGGFLAPIAQQFTTEALNGLFGIVAPGAGFPTSDIGTQQTIGMGFQQSDKINSQTAGNTDAIKKQAEEQTKIQKDLCAKQNATLNEAKNLNDQFYKYGPDAREKSYVTYFQIWKAARKMFTTIFQVSPGTIGATGGTTNGSTDNGQPAVADLPKNKNDANSEVNEKARVLAQEKNSGNIHGNEVSQAFEIIDARQNAASQFKSTLTKEEEAVLKDPTQSKNLPSYKFYENLQKWVDPRNNVDGTFLAMNEQKLAAQQAAKENTLAQYNANGGWNDKRVCVDLRDSVSPTGDPSMPDSPTFNNSTMTMGQWCWKWQTVTQGSTLKALSDKLLTLYFDFLSGVHNVREDFVTQFATQPLTDVQNLRQSSSVSQQTPGSNPCPGTDPCPGTGWQAASSINDSFTNGLNQGTSNLTDDLGNYLNNSINTGLNGGSGSYSGGSNGGGSSFDLGAITNLLGSIQYNTAGPIDGAPEISLTQATTTLASGERQATITWKSVNANLCFAGNNWLSGKLANINIEKEANKPVDLAGEITLTYPANAKFSQSYDLSCYNDQMIPTRKLITVTQ